MNWLLILSIFLAYSSLHSMESAFKLNTYKEIPKNKSRGFLTPQDYLEYCKTQLTYEKFKSCFSTNFGIPNILLSKAGKAGNITAIQFCLKMGARVDANTILVTQKNTHVLQALFGDTSTWEPNPHHKKGINKFLFNSIDLVLLNSLACATTEPMEFILQNNGNPNFVFKSHKQMMCPGYMAIIFNDPEKLAVLFQHGAIIEPNQYMSLLAFSLLMKKNNMTQQLVHINTQDGVLFNDAQCKGQSTDVLNKPIDLYPYLQFAKDRQCDPIIIKLLQEYAAVQNLNGSTANKSKAGASKKFKKNTSN